MAKGSGGRLSGAETAIRDHHGGRPKIVRVGSRHFSREAEAEFLDVLATTCNVTAAMEAADLSRSPVYRRRRTDPEFAARWREALVIGYDRLEARLLESAERVLSGEPPSDDAPFPDISVAQAIVMLQNYRNREKDGRTRTAWRRRDKPIEEVRARLARKLDAIERARDRS